MSGEPAAAENMMIQCCDLVGRLAGGYFLTRLKLVLRRQGIDCGLPRIPLRADVEIPTREVGDLVELIDRLGDERTPPIATRAGRSKAVASARSA